MTYRIAVVCLGNICRSPMAQVVLESRVKEAGLSDRVEVVSAGTGGWHTDGAPRALRWVPQPAANPWPLGHAPLLG